MDKVLSLMDMSIHHHLQLYNHLQSRQIFSYIYMENKTKKNSTYSFNFWFIIRSFFISCLCFFFLKYFFCFLFSISNRFLFNLTVGFSFVFVSVVVGGLSVCSNKRSSITRPPNNKY